MKGMTPPARRTIHTVLSTMNINVFTKPRNTQLLRNVISSFTALHVSRRTHHHHHHQYHHQPYHHSSLSPYCHTFSRSFSAYVEPRFRPPAPYGIFTNGHSVHDKRFLRSLKQRIQEIKRDKRHAQLNDPIRIAMKVEKETVRAIERQQSPGVTYYIYEYLKQHGEADKKTIWKYLLSIDQQHGYDVENDDVRQSSMIHTMNETVDRQRNNNTLEDSTITSASTVGEHQSVDTSVEHTTALPTTTSSATATQSVQPLHPRRVSPPTITAMTRLLRFMVKHKKLNVRPGPTRRDYYQYIIYDRAAVAAANAAKQQKIAAYKELKRQEKYEAFIAKNPKWLAGQAAAAAKKEAFKRKPSTWISYEERQQRKQQVTVTMEEQIHVQLSTP